MDIVFVNSINFMESNSIPLGLLSLGTILNDEGYKVKILDFDNMFISNKIKLCDDIDLVLNNICDEILKQNSKIVSFYTMCNSYPFTIKLAQLLKFKNKDIIILFGGPQATLTAVETLSEFLFIDLIGMGEGETTIVNIVDSIINKKDKSLLNGVAYRNGDKIIVNNDAKLLKDLDDLPYIKFELLDNKKITNGVDIDVGRGCPFSCNFCSTSLFWKRNYRLKSNSRLIKEINIFKEKYHIQKFGFNHDMFTANKQRIVSFCKEVLAKKLDIKWGCSARIDCLDDELLYYMSKAGCTQIFIGIESGSQKIQNIINKNLNVKLIFDKIMSLKRFKIKPTVSFIYGFYEETVDDLNDTLNLIFKLLINDVIDIQLHRLVVMPGTRIYNSLKDKLYLNSSNLNTNIFEIRYLKDLVALISSNKKLFCNFYEFDTYVRKNFYNLDTLVYLFTFIYSYFRFTLIKILDSYQSNYIEIYKDYKVFIDDLVYKINLNQYEDIDLEKVTISKLFFDCFDKIFDKYLSNINNDRLTKKIYNFEKDVTNFRKYSKEEEKVIVYDFDVITALKNIDKYILTEKCNANKVKLVRMNKDKAKIVRVR